jgi:hypothetical protein
MAEIVRLAKVEEGPAAPLDFLLTDTAKDCLRALPGISANLRQFAGELLHL